MHSSIGLRRKVICLAAAVAILAHAIPGASAQQAYLVGSSSVSIEPDSSVFSLALAGYGAPREGRFSLEWRSVGQLGDIKAVAAIGARFFAIDEAGALVTGDFPIGELTASSSLKWKKFSGRTSALTTINGELYAISDSRILRQKKPKTKASWEVIASAPPSATALAIGERSLYVVANGELLESHRGGKSMDWRAIAFGGGEIKDILIHNGRLYAIDEQDELWWAPDRSEIVWTKIGVRNGTTYDVPIKRLFVRNDRLYMLSEEGELYIADHASDGSLSVNAMAIKAEDQLVVIVGVDLTGFDFTWGEEIKQAISSKWKIPTSAILINASHTHFAPVSQSFPTFGPHGQIPDSLYLNNILKRRVIKAVGKAVANLSPAALYFGRDSTAIGYNRSLPGDDKPYDNTLDVLKASDKEGKVTGILFLTGCHPVARNDGRAGVTISANYPGVTRNILDDRYPFAHTVFLQGCGGDINPVSNDHRETGKELADDVNRVLDKAMIALSGNISHAFDTIAVPTQPWDRGRIIQFRAQNLGREGDVWAEKNVRWADMMLEYYREGTVPTTMHVYVQTINIGEWKLVGISREVVTEYGPAIRAIWPEKLVSVAGYCNDMPSYLPTGRHIAAGVYEGGDSFFWNAQPSFFPENIFNIIIDNIRKTKNQ